VTARNAYLSTLVLATVGGQRRRPARPGAAHPMLVALFALVAICAAPHVRAVADDADGPDGGAVFAEHCAGCHAGSGAARAPNILILANQTADAIERTLNAGVMQQQAAALSPAERRAVAEFISPPSSVERIAPKLCEDTKVSFDTPPLPGWGTDLANTRYFGPDLTTLNATTLPRLKVKWVFAFPGANRARAQPSPVGDSVLVGSHDGTVYALAEDSGCVRWQYRAGTEVRTGIAIMPAERPLDTPLAIFGDMRAHVYGIDARSGEPIWKTKISDHVSALITATPVVHEGVVYAPLTSLEKGASFSDDYPCCTFQGMVAALDAATGRILWRTSLIDEPVRETGTNAAGTPSYGPSGAGVWSSPTIDPERGLLYVGTGNAYTHPAHDHTDAIVALELDSGAIRWARQTLAGDAWNAACMEGFSEGDANCPEGAGPDFDFGAPPVLVETPDGQRLIGGQKSGDVWGFDPADAGRILWERSVGTGTIFGGIHFGLAVDGTTVYAGVSEFDAGQTIEAPLRPGVSAVDAVTGERIWNVPADDVCGGRQFCHPGVSAPISAFDGFALVGHSDGRLRAYARGSGEILWEFDTTRAFETVSGERAHGGSIGGAAGPVAYGDMLYVTSGYGVVMQMPGNVLIAFEVADDATDAL